MNPSIRVAIEAAITVLDSSITPHFVHGSGVTVEVQLKRALTAFDELVREVTRLRQIETAAMEMLYDIDNSIGSDEWSTSELRAALGGDGTP